MNRNAGAGDRFLLRSNTTIPFGVSLPTKLYIKFQLKLWIHFNLVLLFSTHYFTISSSIKINLFSCRKYDNFVRSFVPVFVRSTVNSMELNACIHDNSEMERHWLINVSFTFVTYISIQLFVKTFKGQESMAWYGLAGYFVSTIMTFLHACILHMSINGCDLNLIWQKKKETLKYTWIWWNEIHELLALYNIRCWTNIHRVDE